MKLLPSRDTARRALSGEDGLTRGIDAALTLGLFFGLGYAADRWLGTTPVFTVVGSVLAVVGLFLAWRSRYMAQMEALEAQRRDDATGNRPAVHDAGRLNR
jgi:F0F1-type ATP synthase assembly protein I